MQLLLVDLPIEDVLCKKILCYLNLIELCRLKYVCKLFADTIPFYLKEYRETIDLTDVGKKKKFNKEALNFLFEKENLKHFYVKGCRHWIKDDTIISMVKNNKQLQSLDVEDCYSLSNDFFFTIGDYLLQIKYLNLSFCRDLSSDALMYIGENLRHLKELNVSSCWAINDLSVIVIATNNSDLEILKIASCYALTDQAISSVAKNCLLLKVLDMSGCWRVKDYSIVLLNEYCKKLKELYIKDCTNVTEISLARLRPKGVRLDRRKPIMFSRDPIPYVNI